MSPDAPPPTGSPPPASSDPGSDPLHGDDDQRPGLRIRLAAVLLGQGRDPLDVARTTGVPLALIELINDDLGQQPRTDPPRGDGQGPPPRSSPTPADIDPAAHYAAGDLRHPGSDSARRRSEVVGWRFRWAARTLRTAFLLNAALAAVAAHSRSRCRRSIVDWHPADLRGSGPAVAAGYPPATSHPRVEGPTTTALITMVVRRP